MKIRLLLPALAASLSFHAQAIDLLPAGAFVQGGAATQGTYSASAGVFWPWSWRRETARGEWTGITELFVSHWSADTGSGREGLTQVGLLPLLRYHFARGPGWFAEGGIGVSTMDQTYRTEEKQFSSRFNFIDVLGVGRSFGAQGRSELGLRLSHVSNAGIKKPNPGENFVQLRYAVRF